MIGVDVGIGLLPQDGMFQETKKTVEAFSLFGDCAKCFSSPNDCIG
jgi:hypothetical protein